MTEKLRESISALMDDEANELELHRLLTDMESEGDVRATWRRYQLASSAMKKQLNGHSHIDISQRVSSAITDLAIDEEEERAASPATRVAKSLTSLAVAASVAFLVVFGVSQVGQLDSDSNPAVADKAPFQNNTQVASSIDSSGVLPANAELTPSQKRLRMLMERHAHQADISRGSGVMPNVQLVSQERDQ